MPDYLFGDIQFFPADRQPCIVCGHETGDCIPEDHKPPIKIFGIGLFDSKDKEEKFTVLEDVYAQQQVSPIHSVRVRRFKKGQQIPLSTARENGLTDL